MQDNPRTDDRSVRTEKDPREGIRLMAEANANLFNIKCLAVFAVMAIITEVLNELGLFKVARPVMITSMALSFTVFIMPLAVLLISAARRGERQPVIERSWFRKLIMTCGFIGTVFVSVSLSFHAIVYLTVPILLAAQYGNRRREFFWVMIGSIILVPVSVYGSFFLGTPDRNFLKGLLTDEEALDFYKRLTLVAPKRMLELFLHYVLPRLFGVVSVGFLASGITRRNSKMSERQIELSQKVREEMSRRHDMQNRVIELLANVIETRDVSTGQHIIHTKQYVDVIARAMREDDRYREIMTPGTIDRLKNAAPLHDVGKIVVPDSILLKPGKLTPEEYERMKDHATAGGKLIKEFFAGMNDIEFLKYAEEIAVSHHEKWDGTGYPDGLKGEEIPLSARIMAVADVFDALVSVRVYKDAIAPEAAFEVIYSESGTHFDPDIIRIVRTIEPQMIEIANSNI